MITLDSIDSSLHSIQIKDAAGDALAISAGGAALIEAVDLDIRNLVFATDKVDASGSSVALDAPTLAALESITVQNGAGAAAVNIQDGGNSITVDAVDLDIRDLAFATDKVDASGSVVALDAPTLAALESITVQNGAGGAAVNIQDGGNSITVDAVDLDIRNLVFATDKVDVSGSLIETVEGGYDTWKVTAETVDTTAGGVQLVAAPLASRLRVEIQNLGTQDIYIKNATGVTTANGLKIPKGSSYEQALDAGAQIWAIAPSGSSDVRVAEYAA